MRCPGCDHDNLPGEDLCAGCGMDLAGLDVEAWGVSPDDPVLVTRLGDLPLKRPLVAPANTTVAAAIEQMRDRHEGCVFVVDEPGRLVGIVTERDVVRVAARGRDLQRTQLEDAMTRHPVALERQDALAWALHHMGVEGRRHVAVVEDGRPVGFLSVRTVLRVLLEA